MSNENGPKTRDYVSKDFDSLTAEELRHGALKWLRAEAKGEGHGDEKAARATEIKMTAVGEKSSKTGKKALLARIEQLEQRLKNSGGN